MAGAAVRSEKTAEIRQAAVNDVRPATVAARGCVRDCDPLRSRYVERSGVVDVQTTTVPAGMAVVDDQNAATNELNCSAWILDVDRTPIAAGGAVDS